MTLLPPPKPCWKWLKNCNNQTQCWKDVNIPISQSKGETTGYKSAKYSEQNFCVFA